MTKETMLLLFERYRPRLSWLFVCGLMAFCFLYGFAFSVVAPYIILPFLVPIGFIALLIIWALPDSRAPSGFLTSCFYVFLVSLAWPNYLAIELPGLPWITVVRATSFPLVLSFFICLSVSKAFRDTLWNVLSTLPIVWKLLAAFVIVQLITVAFSSNISASLSRFLIAQTNWTSIFFISCYVFSQPGRSIKWCAIIWCMAVFMSIIGVWESFLHRLVWAGHVPSFLKIEDPAVLLSMNGSDRAGAHRVQSTSGTSLGLAEFLALALPFVIHFSTGIFKPLVRIAAILTVPLIIYAALLTGARLGLVGCIITLLGYVFFWSFLHWRKRPDSLIAPSILAMYPAIAAAVIGATLFVGRLRAIVWGNGAQQASTDARIAQYKTGIPIILSNPFGHGIGMAGQALGYYLPSGILTIDTYYLAIALDYGVLGFILYYGLFALAIWQASWKAFKLPDTRGEYGLFLPIALATLNFLVIKSIFSQQDNHPIIYMILGMLVALAYRAKNSASAKINP